MEIAGIRVPATSHDNGATIEVQAVNRAFFLGPGDTPGASYVSGPSLEINSMFSE